LTGFDGPNLVRVGFNNLTIETWSYDRGGNVVDRIHDPSREHDVYDYDCW